MSKFYATQKEAKGSTIWLFTSKAERDTFVSASNWRAELPARRVDAAFRAKGVFVRCFVRWGEARFHGMHYAQ